MTTTASKATGVAVRTCILYMDFLEALEGDHLAALLASRIYWWCVVPSKNGKSKLRVVKDGRLWLAKSSADWGTELGLTRRQVDRCMQKLKDCGLVESKLLMFNAAPTLHLRYIGQIDPENRLSRAIKIQVLLDPIAPPSAIECTAQCNPLHQDVQSITCNTTSSTNMNSIKRVASSTPAKAEDILKSFSQAGEKKAGTTGVLGLKMIWKKNQPEHLGFQKELTAKELGQLKHVLKALGDRSGTTLCWALQNWGSFVSEAQALKGLPSTPSIPHVGFFSAHYDVAVNLMAQSDKPKVLQSIAAPPKPIPVAIPEKQVHTPDTEDFLDVMSKLEKITGSP